MGAAGSQGSRPGDQDLLIKENVDRIDFLSIDVELAEPKVLAGFTVEKYLPMLVCIEAHPEVRQAILDYFAPRGYVVVGKYLRDDVHNLWFTPIASAASAQRRP